MLREIKWSQICDEITKHAPQFAAIIQEIGCDEAVYEVTYPYGALIVDNGVFQLPNHEGHVVPITHASINNKIKEDLGYSGTIPLGMIVENSVESYMTIKDRIIPSSLYHCGQIISLWRVLEKGASYHIGKFWNISSGSRTICMVPHIYDKDGYKKIKNKFNLRLEPPKSLTEHWELFKKIANNSHFYQPWHSRLIFFPKKWLAHQDDPAWNSFFLFLHQMVWQNSSFRRNQFIFDFAFSCVQENRNLKPNPYIADTVRHLIALGSGAVPGFGVATNSKAAPIEGLQKAFIEDYELKKYAPIIVHSNYFNMQTPIYYSFQFPTTTSFSPHSRRKSTIMENLSEVNHIMEILLSEALCGKLNVENTPLYLLAKNTRYGYYHGDKYRNDDVQVSSDISMLDKNFIKLVMGNELFAFPEFAPFFWGCISLSSAKE